MDFERRILEKLPLPGLWPGFWRLLNARATGTSGSGAAFCFVDFGSQRIFLLTGLWVSL